MENASEDPSVMFNHSTATEKVAAAVAALDRDRPSEALFYLQEIDANSPPEQQQVKAQAVRSFERESAEQLDIFTADILSSLAARQPGSAEARSIASQPVSCVLPSLRFLRNLARDARRRVLLVEAGILPSLFAMLPLGTDTLGQGAAGVSQEQIAVAVMEVLVNLGCSKANRPAILEAPEGVQQLLRCLAPCASYELQEVTLACVGCLVFNFEPAVQPLLQQGAIAAIRDMLPPAHSASVSGVDLAGKALEGAVDVLKSLVQPLPGRLQIGQDTPLLDHLVQIIAEKHMSSAVRTDALQVLRVVGDSYPGVKQTLEEIGLVGALERFAELEGQVGAGPGAQLGGQLRLPSGQVPLFVKTNIIPAKSYLGMQTRCAPCNPASTPPEASD